MEDRGAHPDHGGQQRRPAHGRRPPSDSEEPLEHEAMDHTVHGRDVDHAAAGHRGHHVDHAGHEALFRRRFWISLALALPVLAYSPMIQQWLGFRAPAFPGSEWVAPVLSLIVFLIGGLPFLSMALPELRNREPGMMTLISLAITVAFVYSVAALALPGQESFFWELVTLIVVMLLGHWIEMRSVRQASRALDELARLLPDEAERIGSDGRVETVRADALAAGDLVLLRPGASVPADGEVEEGESEVNEAMLTGESAPVPKRPGDRVVAGAINGDGSLRARITAVGEQTALAGIMRLVDEAQRSRSSTQLLADRAAGWLFWVALGVAAVTALAWTAAVGFGVAVIARVATVLVIACPHALGLAIPLVVAVTTALGARRGILIRDRRAMERARLVDTVIFDKTGTLTVGELRVVDSATAGATDTERALALAAAVEGDSEHAVARAIRTSAEQAGARPPAVEAFEALKGRGVRAEIEGREVWVGGPRLLEHLGLELPSDLAPFADETARRGRAVVHLVEDGRPVASFALADAVRPESRSAVARLRALGVEVVMLTGDSRAVAASVAEELGIETFFAEVLPEHKDEKVAELRRGGRRVAMVGDGVNDAPALARADVGIAIGSGTDVAVASAGIVLVASDPTDVVDLLELSRASYRKMVQNLVWATGYNAVALPLAAGVLAPWGVILSPAVGAVFMSASTVIVAVNAQLLRRARFSQT